MKKGTITAQKREKNIALDVVLYEPTKISRR